MVKAASGIIHGGAHTLLPYPDGAGWVQEAWDSRVAELDRRTVSAASRPQSLLSWLKVQTGCVRPVLRTPAGVLRPKDCTHEYSAVLLNLNAATKLPPICDEGCGKVWTF